MARAWVDAIQRSAATDAARLVHVDENLWQRAWRLFVARADKDWSMTDCISFVIMQDHGLSRAFTSDKHFEQAGFARLIISPA